METAQEFSSFWEHISALRRTLGRMLLVISAGMCISFYFHETIIKGLTSPLAQASFHMEMSDQPAKVETYRFTNYSPLAKRYALPPEALAVVQQSAYAVPLEDGSYEVPAGESISYTVPQSRSPQLVILGPLEGMFVALKTSLWTGLVATSPLWLWLGLRFVLPALTRAEKRLVLPFFILSSILVAVGMSFTFYITIPIANGYLAAFNQGIGANLWSLAHYLDYTLFLLLANGLAFELGAVGLMAVHVGLVSAAWLSRKRRAFIVLAFIIGALLTPPDVLTQLMLALPLILFYEAIILYARICRR